MSYLQRQLNHSIHRALNRDKGILLLGPRQTGKTTLINQLPAELRISFAHPSAVQRYERHPSSLISEVRALAEGFKHVPLIVLDEVQKVPVMLDVAQLLIDEKLAQFVLTGSSARKLKVPGQINLLPGRVVAMRLDPLMVSEMLTVPKIEDLLYYGSLPGIICEEGYENKNTDLISYVTTYLEEEIRAEAVVRNVSRFARFLALAASESGKLVSFRKLSQEIGLTHTTIANYYQILEDCLILERVDPLLQTKTRRRLTKSSKYLFFDLGIRRIAAEEGTSQGDKTLGDLFEQFIGLELIRNARLQKQRTHIYFWRDTAGPEVDWIISKEGKLTPIEVKWSATPTLNHAKHLELFLNEHPQAEKGIIVCQTPRKMKLSDRIEAVPWQMLASLFD